VSCHIGRALDGKFADIWYGNKFGLTGRSDIK
jgi:hypothetical protein